MKRDVAGCHIRLQASYLPVVGDQKPIQLSLSEDSHYFFPSFAVIIMSSCGQEERRITFSITHSLQFRSVISTIYM